MLIYHLIGGTDGVAGPDVPTTTLNKYSNDNVFYFGLTDTIVKDTWY